MCRAYSRKHVNCMIAEKIYKSTLWLTTLRKHKSSLTCNSFSIAVYVKVRFVSGVGPPIVVH